MTRTILLFIIFSLCLVECFLTFLVFTGKGDKKRKMRVVFLALSLYSIFQVVIYITTSYQIQSVCQSLSTIMKTIALVSGLKYLAWNVDRDKSFKFRVCYGIILAIAAIDILAFMVNPFYEFIMSFGSGTTGNDGWIINAYVPYYIHKGFIHITILVTILCAVSIFTKMSNAYGRGYLFLMVWAMVLSFVNIVFKLMFGEAADSIAPVFLGAFLIILYWVIFVYSDGQMLDHVRFLALNENANPTILFDYKGKLIMSNRRINSLYMKMYPGKSEDEISDILVYHKYSIDDFKQLFNIANESLDEDKFFNISFVDNKTLISYRVDYVNMYDNKSRYIGKFFSFNDTTEEMDELTGFHKKEAFNKVFADDETDVKYPVSVLLIDVKNLSRFNDISGKEKGDKFIQLVAVNMMKNCPQGTYFLRGDGADLYAICPDTNEHRISEIVERIQEKIGEKISNDSILSLRCTYGIARSKIQNLVMLVDNVKANMKIKKMIDMEDNNNSILDSIIQMQKEADPYLATHIKRIRHLCDLMADKLGMSDYKKNNLALLCLIHDIGNIGIPVEIVNKPGRLTDKEWEVMKSHVEKGYRIASASDDFKEVALSVLHHHEYYDGSGYPDGLRGESIPYLSRIMSVVEAYDAMTSERPYRPPMKPSEAKKEIIKCKGKYYDPVIVDVFVELLDEIVSDNETDKAQDKQSTEGEETKLAPMSVIGDNKRKGYVDKIRHSTYILDEQNVIIEIDDAFENITGYSREDVNKYKLNQIDLIFDSDKESYSEYVNELIESTGEAYLEHRIKCKDGTEKYVFCFGRRYYDGVAKAGRSTIIITDISESKKAINLNSNERSAVEYKLDLKELSQYNLRPETTISYDKAEEDVDSITGLMTGRMFAKLNGRLFANTLESLLLLAIDIDNFTAFSNNNGKTKANEMIRYVATCINQLVSNQGIAARTDIDSFKCTITMLEENDIAIARARVAEIWGALMDLLNDKYEGASLSMGAFFAPVNKSSDRSFEIADAMARQALDKVKADGKKGYYL